MYSRTVIIGRLGKDPTLVNAGPNPALSFSVASSESYKGQDGQWKEVTTWHNCQVWGKLAPILATKIQKGDLVLVEGTYRTNKGKNRDGYEVTYYNLRADIVKRLNSRVKPHAETEPVDTETAPAGLKTTTEEPDPFADQGQDDDDIEVPF